MKQGVKACVFFYIPTFFLHNLQKKKRMKMFPKKQKRLEGRFDSSSPFMVTRRKDVGGAVVSTSSPCSLHPEVEYNVLC